MSFQVVITFDDDEIDTDDFVSVLEKKLENAKITAMKYWEMECH